MESQTESTELLETVVIAGQQQPQYLLHRIPENPQLITPELLQNHGGLVVDIGGGDYIPVNYSSEDLLSQDLTDEDRRLAAALVAVQFNQQQKQQQQIQDANALSQLDHNSTLENKILEEQVIIDKNGGLNSGYLQIVGSDSIYVEKESLPKFVAARKDASPRYIEEVQTNHLPTKNEGDLDKRESDGLEGEKNENRSSKKTLPHKKRITKKLKRTSTSNKKIKCNLCEQFFASSDEFAQHELLCQTTITPISSNLFNCQICNASLTDQLQFFEHLKAHYEPSATITNVSKNPPPVEPEVETEKPAVKSEIISEPSVKDSIISVLNLTCTVCSKTFRKQKTYDAHMKEVHEKYELNEFSEPEDLMEGIEVSVNSNHNSDAEEVDSKAWYKEEELQQTEEDLKELEAEDHVCHICNQPFPLRAILLQHLISCRAITGNTKPTSPEIVKKKNKKTTKAKISCNLCERSFTHRNSLMYHLHSHHTRVRPHQCETCGKRFFASSALKVHRRLHSGERPYHCTECGRTFRQWGDLKYHMTSLHSTEKQFQCEYCGKEFARKYSLVVHRRIHTGEKNYKCEFCEKTFRASSYLQNHRRIHTGEKPHECDICGKPFRVRSDMKRHQKSHNKKPTTKKVYKIDNLDIAVETKAKEEIDHGSNDTAELHINDPEQETEILYEDPLAPRDGMYTNGHQLFLVTYSGDVTKMDSTWIQTTT